MSKYTTQIIHGQEVRVEIIEGVGNRPKKQVTASKSSGVRGRERPASIKSVQKLALWRAK